MSLAQLSYALGEVSRTAKTAIQDVSNLTEAFEQVGQATEDPQKGISDLMAKMKELAIFSGTWSSTFTKPLLESFEKGEISAEKFREELTKLGLKLAEIRALGNVDKQGFGSLDADRQEIERLLHELEKLRGRP